MPEHKCAVAFRADWSRCKRRQRGCVVVVKPLVVMVLASTLAPVIGVGIFMLLHSM